MKDNNNIAKENANLLDNEITSLQNSHWSWGERIYKDFWNHVKEINKLFKSTRPLLKEDREMLWNRLGNICNEARIRQSNESTERKVESKSHYEDIMSLISSSRVNTFFGFDTPDIEEMKRLGNMLKRASKKLSENKHRMLPKHKQECFNEIQEVRKKHDAWWEGLKENRQHKKNDFKLRVRENLDKNYDRHRKATQTLERLKDHRYKLKNDIDSAWSDSFKDRAYGWLAETEGKISDIERFIGKLEEWILEDETKL
ncbi:MAG: hypothetical protein JW866_06965 [Ignavibacteriales bacterium]|nr:hypothetical protein [Ignavibacteriales bacterium]